MKRLAGAKLSIALWAVLILGARSAPVLAESPSVAMRVQRARLHFLAGKHAFERDDFAGALEEFRMGYSIDPRPAFLLDMGHAALHLGSVLKARELYTRFLQTNPPEPEREVATRFVAQIDHELASALEARSSANEPPPSALNPAEAEVRSAAPLRVTSSPTAPVVPRALSAATQEKQPPTFDAIAVDSAPDRRRRWLWGAAGIVAVGVLTALVAGNLGAAQAHADGSWGRITF